MATLGNPLIDQPDQRTLDLYRKKLSALQPQPAAAAPAATHQDAAPMPLSGPSQPAPALSAPTPRPAGPAPLSAATTPLQAEHTRLTAPPIQSGPLAHTKEDTGRSGIGQIHNPWLRGLATIGDAIGSGFFPGPTAAIPGTSLHHQALVRQNEGAQKQDESNATNAANRAHLGAETENLESLPELHKTQAELAASKLGEKTANDQAKVGVQQGRNRNTLHTHGFDLDEHGNVVPLPYESMSEEQKAVHDLRGSQKEVMDATAALRDAQAKNIPEQIRLAEQRIATARANSATASQRLGLSEKQFEMHAHGTENGEALPGSLTTDSGKPVGTAFQQNVRPTGTQRDAAGRADTMLDIDARIRKALEHPDIKSGTGPLAGRLSEIENRAGVLPHDLAELKNDLVSYGAFQAGLHPVRGIGALQYFDKVMGGLGQNPEELIGKLDSNKATADSVKKVGSPKTEGSKDSGKTIRARDPQGKLHEAPAGTPLPGGWKAE